jgi:hypothetical protein
MGVMRLAVYELAHRNGDQESCLRAWPAGRGPVEVAARRFILLGRVVGIMSWRSPDEGGDFPTAHHLGAPQPVTSPPETPGPSPDDQACPRCRDRSEPGARPTVRTSTYGKTEALWAYADLPCQTH